MTVLWLNPPKAIPSSHAKPPTGNAHLGIGLRILRPQTLIPFVCPINNGHAVEQSFPGTEEERATEESEEFLIMSGRTPYSY